MGIEIGSHVRWVGNTVKVGPYPGVPAIEPGETRIVVNISGDKIGLSTGSKASGFFGWVDKHNVELVD